MEVFILTEDTKITKIEFVGAASGRPHSSAYVFAKKRCAFVGSAARTSNALPYILYFKEVTP